MQSRTHAWSVAMALPVAIAWQMTPALSQPQVEAAAQVRLPGTFAETGPIVAQPLDDAIPLPVPAVVQPGPNGDVVVQPASGDPFFLSFVAGPYYPPAGERLDPALLAAVQSQYTDGRPGADTFAFVMFEQRMTPQRIAVLEDLGCRVLQFHPHYTLKVALPVSAIDAVAALDFVHWVGVARPWQKVHTHLTGVLADADPAKPVEVYVSVFESDLNPSSTSTRVGTVATVDPGGVPVLADTAVHGGELWMSNGWQQRALENLGLEVTAYVDRVRVFQARMLPAALESVVALDFVQFVEAQTVDRPYHDESTPGMLQDDTRVFYDGGTNDVAIIGEIDSGIENAHEALNHIYGVGWDDTPETDAWQDACEHGTHVAGTIFGLPPTANEGHTGNAPNLGSLATLRIRNVKRFSTAACTSAGLAHDVYYGHMRADYNDGTNISPKPHAINNSWGSSPGAAWVGTETNATILDAEVWDYNQLYVFAAGNDGSGAGTIGLPAVAKNAFTVGAVVDYDDAVDGDPGSIAGFSSRGPCGDGRWKPNISAPGIWIRSADAGNLTGYFDNAGTSMAAPHITGMAATLCDHFSIFRYAPHRLAAQIMATAMTNNDQVLSSPGDAHLDTYGTGRANSTKAHWSFSDSNWTNWGATLTSGTSTYGDFTVGAGATRVVVCMTYHEDAASVGAGQALINNINLYIDQDPVDTTNLNTGEWVAQQSSIDNTEIRILNNPIAGPWRWKAYSASTTSSCRLSVTVCIIDGDTTPDGTLTVSANDLFVQPNTDVTITATATTPAYFGSNLFFDSTSAGDTLQSSSTTLEDGLVTDLMDNQSNGRDVLVGTSFTGQDRTATWVTRWATEGNKSWCVNARSDNWVDETDCVNVIVDGTPPGLVTNLTSSTHTANVWTNDNTITYTWTAATDNLSGIDGYGIFTSSGTGAPSTVKDIEEVTSYGETLSDGSWYFNIRSVDNCGNWDDVHASTGPYRIDTAAPTQPGVISSTTHTVGVQSCNTTVTVNWASSTDSLSGLDHYWGAWNTIAVFDPVGGSNISAASTSNTTNIGSSTSARYFHLRPLDNAGNYGPTRHFGPIYANAASVATYCTAKTNSLGCLPAIGSVNQPDKSAGNFAVTCTNVLNQKNGLLFWGYGSLAIPFQGGTKCVAAPSVRTPNIGSGGNALPANDCSGNYSFTFTTAYLNANAVAVGDTLYAQWWMRDPASPSTTGLSNGIKFTICE